MLSRASITFTFGVAALSASSLVWIACSGTSSTSPTNGGGSGSGSSSSGSSGSGSSGSGSSGSGSSGSGSSGSGSSGSGSSGSGSSGSGSSGSGSGSSSGGSVGDGGACPGTPCQNGGTCCADIATATPACETTCAANDTIGCTGPADCTGAAAGTECCATAVVVDNPDGAAFPYCTISSLTSACGSNCPTDTALNCSATDKLHVCTAASDCANDSSGATSCCSVYNYNVCLNPTVALFGKLTCM